ncbi:FkbM family methyltransferase [Actinomycetospora chiangmaiensis]|uniref:FkbM family methyltransferase n=1 Tax=Actinomycetospora chiangmaiensis TaxID=402650 RepID=UPI000364A473|nr:FkbM family methyltransferase [Actinomycetospora chiangmaiensis]
MSLLETVSARLRPAFATAMLTAGISVGPPSDPAQVRELMARLRPVDAGFRLVRLGDDGDGGYLAPDDLDGVVACFSPGVDNRASFELGMAARGVPCFLADGTVPRSPVEHELLHFRSTNIGVVDGPSTTTMDSWIDGCAPPSGDLVLQMDIEGFEVPALLNISDRNLARCRIMIVEFHELDGLFARATLRQLQAVFDRLLAGHHLVHVHANNYGGVVSRRGVGVPRVIEATFLRRDRVASTRPVAHLPHPLDIRNAPHLPDVQFPLLDPSPH